MGTQGSTATVPWKLMAAARHVVVFHGTARGSPWRAVKESYWSVYWGALMVESQSVSGLASDTAVTQIERHMYGWSVAQNEAHSLLRHSIVRTSAPSCKG